MEDFGDALDAADAAQTWMVEIILPVPMSTEFASLIPEQRRRIGKLMRKGKMLSYTLTTDRSRLWTVLRARDEAEVREILRTFPIIGWTEYTVHELFFHEYSLSGMMQPSMN